MVCVLRLMFCTKLTFPVWSVPYTCCCAHSSLFVLLCSLRVLLWSVLLSLVWCVSCIRFLAQCSCLISGVFLACAALFFVLLLLTVLLSPQLCFPACATFGFVQCFFLISSGVFDAFGS